MKRKYLVNAILTFVFLNVLVGAGYKQENDKVQVVVLHGLVQESESEYTEPTEEALDTSEQEETQVAPTEYEEEKHCDEIADAINTLLADGTAEFYANYPVDETFFSWLESRYGMGTIEQIASEVSRGKAKPKLWYQLTGSTMHVLWLEYCKDHAYQTYRLTNVTWKDCSDASQIRIDFVGDINFDPTWYTMKYAKENGGVDACISNDILDELNTADVTMVNNEFCYTKSKKKYEDKAYSFKTNPENVKLLSTFGTDIVSLANNHTCDYGEQGLLDTIDTLKDAGIVYSGAGRNLAEASAVQYFVVGGRKIAFVSATEIERFYHFTKKAGEKTPGVLKTQQKEAVLSALQEARRNSDYVIMFVHWGAEGKVKQDADQRALTQEYAAAGVDAIIGSHPHRLQGVEYVGNVPVVYSLGNFWFSTGTLYATVAQIQIDDSGELKLRLLPCIQKDEKTTLLKGKEECKSFYQYVADLSSGVQIDGKGFFAPFDESQSPQVPPAYRSGRQYGQRFDDADLELRSIDVVGNLQ